MATLSGNAVIEFDPRKKDSLHAKGFGEVVERKLVLDLHEALYLLERENLEVEDRKGATVSEKELLKLASKEKNFASKHAVFKDLKERGYVVKTGFKFGFDFRVYPRGKKPGEAHSQWVVSVHAEKEKFSLPELSRMIRLAGNLKTKLLFAIVDREHQVSYYESERITP